MGWLDRVTEFLPTGIFVPSPGQGALAVEIRAGEDGPAALLADLDEPVVSNAVRVERAFLAAMGGGCTSPVGALATIDGDDIELVAMIGSEDGARAEWATERFPVIAGEERAADLARRMLAAVGQTFMQTASCNRALTPHGRSMAGLCWSPATRTKTIPWRLVCRHSARTY